MLGLSVVQHGGGHAKVVREDSITGHLIGNPHAFGSMKARTAGTRGYAFRPTATFQVAGGIPPLARSTYPIHAAPLRSVEPHAKAMIPRLAGPPMRLSDVLIHSPSYRCALQLPANEQ